MANETEKLTLNLGVVELAQIDVLTERGLCANRSDFIRTAVRKHLEGYEHAFQQQLASVPGEKHRIGGIGIISLSRKTLEAIERERAKANISVIGMLVLDKNISTELFQNTVEYISVKGRLSASDEIKKTIREMNGGAI